MLECIRFSQCSRGSSAILVKEVNLFDSPRFIARKRYAMGRRVATVKLDVATSIRQFLLLDNVFGLDRKDRPSVSINQIPAP